jgi:hypothetical protein
MKIIKIYDEDIHKDIKLMAVESGVTIEVIVKKLLDFYKENDKGKKLFKNNTEKHKRI